MSLHYHELIELEYQTMVMPPTALATLARSHFLVEPGRKFYDRHFEVLRRKLIQKGWEVVRSRKAPPGAPGGVTSGCVDMEKQQVWIRRTLPFNEQLRVLIHETAHILDFAYNDAGNPFFKRHPTLARALGEVHAEGVDFLVSKKLGMFNHYPAHYLLANYGDDAPHLVPVVSRRAVMVSEAILAVIGEITQVGGGSSVEEVSQ